MGCSVTNYAGWVLLGAGRARHYTVGLVHTTVSWAIMPLPSYGQRRTAVTSGPGSAVADFSRPCSAPSSPQSSSSAWL